MGQNAGWSLQAGSLSHKNLEMGTTWHVGGQGELCKCLHVHTYVYAYLYTLCAHTHVCVCVCVCSKVCSDFLLFSHKRPPAQGPLCVSLTTFRVGDLSRDRLQPLWCGTTHLGYKKHLQDSTFSHLDLIHRHLVASAFLSLHIPSLLPEPFSVALRPNYLSHPCCLPGSTLAGGRAWKQSQPCPCRTLVPHLLEQIPTLACPLATTFP